MNVQGFTINRADLTVMESKIRGLNDRPTPWQEVAKSLPFKRLKLSDSGEEVQQLQLALQGLSLYVGPIDGHFGTATERAVLRLQRQSDLKETGHFDEATWQALRSCADSLI